MSGSLALHRLGRRRSRSAPGLTDGVASDALRAARLGRRRDRGRRAAACRSPGKGMRDHSWGVRDWQRVPYWRWFGMVVDPDNFLMLNNVGLADGGETAGGFLMRDGEIAPIVVVRDGVRARPRARLPARLHARAHATSSGRETTLRRAARSRWRRCASAATAA